MLVHNALLAWNERVPFVLEHVNCVVGQGDNREEGAQDLKAK